VRFRGEDIHENVLYESRVLILILTINYKSGRVEQVAHKNRKKRKGDQYTGVAKGVQGPPGPLIYG